MSNRPFPIAFGTKEDSIDYAKGNLSLSWQAIEPTKKFGQESTLEKELKLDAADAKIAVSCEGDRGSNARAEVCALGGRRGETKKKF